MKYLSLLLLLSCGQVVAQKKTDSLRAEIITLHSTKGAVTPVHFRISDTALKFVSYYPDSSFMLHGVDSAGAIKILIKGLKELQQEKEELKSALAKSVTFSNTIPQTYKSGKEWKEFLSVMKKLGYEKIKQ